MSTSDEWIGVAEVAALLNYTHRQAWELIRALAVPGLNMGRMDSARFTRAHFDEARERAMRPAAPRARVGAVAQAAGAGGAPPGRAKPAGESVAAKVARIRRA